MLRSCSDAPSSSACETAGYRPEISGSRAMSFMRASAPMLHAAVAAILNPCQREVVDVDEQIGPGDAGPDQVDLRGPARKKSASRIGGDGGDGVEDANRRAHS